MLKEKANDPSIKEASRIRKFIVGGEAFSADLATEINEIYNGKVELYNEYGPTEATIGCMVHRFNSSSDNRLSVPVGEGYSE